VAPFIHPDTKGIETEEYVLETYYDPELAHTGFDEAKASGNYYWGKIDFRQGMVSLLPKEQKNIDFKEHIEALTSICRREKLTPMSPVEWEEIYGHLPATAPAKK
jgi:hypothetical protein